MYCKKCKRSTNSDWSFCAYCGTDIHEVCGDRSDKNDEQDRDSIGEKQDAVSTASRHIIDDTSAINNTDVGRTDDVYELSTDENAVEKLNEKPRLHSETLRSVTLNIALAGKSGCGKSTLINALRGLKSDDVGAAKIGHHETTEPTSYEHQNIPNLVLWDLPGDGTKHFPKESYAEKVKFDCYDFIILVSDTRFMESDSWLAQKISGSFPLENLFFVRTKIDNELSNINASRNTPLTDEQQKASLADMTKDSYEQLRLAGIKDPHIFMINSNNPTNYDFVRLQDTFIKMVSELKGKKIVFTQFVLPNNILTVKENALTERIKTVSKEVAELAVESKRDIYEYLEAEVLQRELLEYQKELQIDTHAIKCIEEALSCENGAIYAELSSESDQFLTNFKEYRRENDTIYNSVVYNMPSIWICKSVRISFYEKQCNRVLKEVLRKCINDAETLRGIIGKWKPC